MVAKKSTKKTTKKTSKKKTSTKKTTKKKSPTKKTTTKKTATKKTVVKKTTPKKVAPVVEEPKEEVTVPETDSEEKPEGKMGQFFVKVKDTAGEMSKKVAEKMATIPDEIDEPENKLHMTTSKLFALTGSLFALFEGRAIILAYQAAPAPFWPVTAGIVGVVFGLFMFLTLNIIDFSKVTKKSIPYKWYLLEIFGFLLFLFNLLVLGNVAIRSIKGGTDGEGKR